MISYILIFENLCFLSSDVACDDNTSTSAKAMEELNDDNELQAVAKHFGKELHELTLEALIKLEGEGSEEEEIQQENFSKRKGPSLASILGRMSSSATLGLSETISHCEGDDMGYGAFVSWRLFF